MEKVAPKSFCCAFSLRSGTIVSAVLMIIITLVAIIMIALDAAVLKNTVKIYEGHMRTVYGHVVTAIFFCLFVFIVNIWLIWGVCREKASVVFGACLIQAIFILYLFCSILVMIILFKASVDFTAWVCCVLFFIVFIAILVYLNLVVLGYWKSLKYKATVTTTS